MNNTQYEYRSDNGKKRLPIREITIYLICLGIAFLLFISFSDERIDIKDAIGLGDGTGDGTGIGDGTGPGIGGGSGGGSGGGTGKGKGSGSGENNAEGEGGSSSDDEGEGKGGGAADKAPEKGSSSEPTADTSEAAESSETSNDDSSPESKVDTSETMESDDSQEDNEETDEDDAEEMVLDVSKDKWEPSTIRIGEKKDTSRKKAKRKKKSGKNVVSKGKTSGRKGSGGGGGGGKGRKRKVYTKTVGGIKVVASKLGVVLDVSGSMTPYLKALKQEIDRKFKGSTYYEVVGCSLYTGKENKRKRKSLLGGKGNLGGSVSLGGARGDLGGLAIKREKSTKVLKAKDSLTAMLRLIKRSRVDAIYWFCDLQDGETPEALSELEESLKRYGVRLYVNSLDRDPNPGLMQVIEKSDGAFNRHGR